MEEEYSNLLSTLTTASRNSKDTKMTRNYKIGSLDPEENIKGFIFEAKRPTYSYIPAIHFKTLTSLFTVVLKVMSRKELVLKTSQSKNKGHQKRSVKKER